MTHRSKVGGLWDEIGKLQFDFMVSQGLEPHHRLLDIGCGCLRGGVHFIRYLDDENYYGMDKDENLVTAGLKELVAVGLNKRWFSLVVSNTFDFFEKFKFNFDFAIAQSLFTHLNLNEILLCLVEAEKVLKPRGKLYASFFTCANKADYAKVIEHHTTDDDKIIWTRAAFSRSMHYTFDILEWAGNWAGLRCDYIGEWGHPRKQEMVVYYR